MTHDASDCPMGKNPPPPPAPEDDEDGPDYNPEGVDEEPHTPETVKGEEQNKEEDHPSASKKRKTEPSTSTGFVAAFPLVCCEMRQAYAIEDTQQCYSKRNRQESEVLEVRNWFTIHTIMPTEQFSSNAERETPTNPGEGTVGHKPPELR
ncbi:unnamed protein product [Arabidopsis halleri]